MPRAKNDEARPLETICEVPDALWERFEPILARRYPPTPTGRSRADQRRVLNGVIFRLRSGCQWNRLPERFGDDSTVHRWFHAGPKTASSRSCGHSSSRSARSWARSTGAGKPADGSMGKARMSGGKRGPIPQTEPKRARRRA